MFKKENFLQCCSIFFLGYWTAKLIRYLKGHLVLRKKLLFLLKNMFFSKVSYKTKEMEKFFYQNVDSTIIEKHGKHFNISEISINSFHAIFQTKVLIIGIGGLGSPVLLYLSKFDFAEIGLVDGDIVETSNLNRQIIHKKKYVGINKCISAKHTLEEMAKNRYHQEKRKVGNQINQKNTNDNFLKGNISHIVCYPVYLNKQNGFDIIKQYDIILDCTDNISTRFLINDLCLLYKKKLVFGSALGLYGQLNVFNLSDPNSNCYRCIKAFNNHKENIDCDDNGILATVTGVIGILQANETVKLAAGLKEQVLKKFLTFNSFSHIKPFEALDINRKNKNCICSKMNSDMLYDFIQKHNYEKNDAVTTELLISVKQCADKTTISKSYIDISISSNENTLYGKEMGCHNVIPIKYKYDIDAYTFFEILKNNLRFFPFEVNHVKILDVRKENNIKLYGLKNAITWDFYDITQMINKYQHEKEETKKSYVNAKKNIIEQIFNKLELISLEGTIVIIVICRRGIHSMQVTKLFNDIFFCYNNDNHNATTDKNNYKNFHFSKIKKIIAYNMKGGYFQLRKQVYTDLPFL